MKKLTPRFAAAADSARGDFRAFLSRLYKKDFNACDDNGTYISICNGEVMDIKKVLNKDEKKTLERIGIYFISNTAPEYIFKIIEANARANARANACSI